MTGSTSTETIAERAGISQPYLFRLLRFFATGMLLNVSAALALPRMRPGEPQVWAASFRRGT